MRALTTVNTPDFMQRISMKDSKQWTLEEETLYSLKTFGKANLGIRRQGRRDE